MVNQDEVALAWFPIGDGAVPEVGERAVQRSNSAFHRLEIRPGPIAVARRLARRHLMERHDGVFRSPTGESHGRVAAADDTAVEEPRSTQ